GGVGLCFFGVVGGGGVVCLGLWGRVCVFFFFFCVFVVGCVVGWGFVLFCCGFFLVWDPRPPIA
ncbi:hypothetical protein, partial [Streptomyces sp. SP18CS02]|uniref:hypothetical protein n=1 Tax=Streptomyces sp. SP18CS02 TaxID=3002531 RepID=UPI002E776DA2